MDQAGRQTTDELEAGFGDALRALRLAQNLDQQTVAARAGVSTTALKNLEAGGGTVRTLVRVLRALGREGWLASVRPPTPLDPFTLTRAATPRQRARRRA